MPRSPLTETYEKVNDIFQTINALEPDQRNLLLDWLFPEPEPTKKPQKKSSKKAVGGGGRSKRGESIKGQLNKSLQQQRKAAGDNSDDEFPDLLGDHEACVFNLRGQQCGAAADANVHHLNTSADYHEFVSPPASSAAGVGD